jgi:hypothetical protein
MRGNLIVFTITFSVSDPLHLQVLSMGYAYYLNLAKWLIITIKMAMDEF